MKSILVIGTGYIGSRLILDFEKEGVFDITYSKSLDDFTIVSKFDVVVYLLGRCKKKSIETFNENVNVFTKLLKLMNDNQMLIYTSSSSVYGNNKDYMNKETDTCSLDNYYDISKYTMDSLAKVSGLHYYSLRIGTVYGYSPIPRNDLMVNSMMYSLVNDGCIRVCNGYTHRPILGFIDLFNAIKTIINTNNKNLSGVYNLASFNMSINEIAESITTKDNIIYVDDYFFNKELYDICIDTSKFQNVFNFKFQDTLERLKYSEKQI